ncbi:MAG: mechanosensitive ion channel family protein, partial [Dehalococcoidia bacterium]
YEAVQADIFDHLIVAATEFDLRVFQQPSGHDFTALNNTMVPRGDDVTLDPSTAP